VEPRLGAIARYVYGMVHSALVRAGDTSMDWRVFKRLLWSRLDPMVGENAAQRCGRSRTDSDSADRSCRQQYIQL